MCKVNGSQYLHFIKAIRGERYQIGNTLAKLMDEQLKFYLRNLFYDRALRQPSPLIIPKADFRIQQENAFMSNGANE